MSPTGRQARRGFTLLELLAVIAILGILLALAFAVWGAVLGPTRAKATRATIAKVDNYVRERMQAFDRNVGNRAYENEVISTQSSLGVSRELAEVIVVKRARRAVFPQFLYDSKSNDPNELLKRQAVGLNPALKAILDKFMTDSRLPPFLAANHNRTPESRATESSELLYYILTHGDALGVPPVGEDQFSTNEVADTDEDGRKEFVDAWGRPLRFYLYPTRLIHPDGDASTAPTAVERDAIDLLIYGTRNEVLQQDPDDPKGAFGTWLVGVPSSGGEVHWHTPYTYHVPLIVSAGEDGELGLLEPTDLLGFGHLAAPTAAVFAGGGPNESALNDNVTNYQQGGRGQ